MGNDRDWDRVLLLVEDEFLSIFCIYESLPDDGERTHQRTRVNPRGLFLAYRVEGDDLSDLFFKY
jgi:hypothetical protein